MVRAAQVVICAGVWSGEVGRLAGIELPVVPRRGEIVVTERGAGLSPDRFATKAGVAAARQSA